MIIRSLQLEDLDAYVRHCALHSAEPGRDGNGYSGPYSVDEVFDSSGFAERTRERWKKAPDTPGWRRAWGAWDGDRIVGGTNVAGGDLVAGLHRVDLGISVLRSHRRRGLGLALLDQAIEWCRAQESIQWIDLGVFSDNVAAHALFRNRGFVVVGTTRDRWRVDGHVIDEMAMTLHVGDDSPSGSA